MHEMRRDVDAMLYWALRWHEGHRLSEAALCDVLWGEFSNKPKDPAGSLRELMAYVQRRHGDKWAIEDCGGAFRILPRVPLSKSGNTKLRVAPRVIERTRAKKKPRRSGAKGIRFPD